MSASTSAPTVDELIATLRKTSLPTLLVEGGDDLIVYRCFEQRLAHLGLSVMQAGGRSAVLEVFARRAEISNSVSIAFIADRDTWTNTGIPSHYVSPCLIFTNGYSIENDVYRDGNLVGLLTAAEREKFDKELEAFIEWYALALSRHLADPSFAISLRAAQVLEPTQRTSLLGLRHGEVYPEDLRTELMSNHATHVRGRSLLDVLMRQLCYKGRLTKHSYRSLLEMVAIRPGPCLESLTARAASVFDPNAV
jgi:hypothetical protein